MGWRKYNKLFQYICDENSFLDLVYWLIIKDLRNAS
jgi:hypothetical protein